MSEYEMLIQRVQLLEYHQKLLLDLIVNPKLEFYKLIVKHGLSEHEVKKFYTLCDKLSKKMEEQKAEEYVYFHPLFDDLSVFLPAKLDIKEVIKACLSQNLYLPLFQEFVKYI